MRVTVLYQRIHRLATWPVMALLSVAIVVCVQGFIWRQAALGWPNQVLDAHLGYTSAEAQRVLAALGAPGRHLYAATQLTLDVIFPLVYGLFFAVLMVRLYPLEQAGILFTPLLMVVADLAENVLTAMLAWNYTGQTLRPGLACRRVHRGEMDSARDYARLPPPGWREGLTRAFTGRMRVRRWPFTGPPVKRPVEEAEPRQGGTEIMAMSLRRCLDVAKAITLPPPVNRFR